MRPGRFLCSTGVLVIIVALGAGSLGQEPKAKAKAKAKAGPTPAPPGVMAQRDIDYVGKGLEAQRLDLYLPQDAKGPLPLVVWIHGGGWQGGAKNPCPAVFLSTRGFAVASVEYRLAAQGPFPIMIEDCRAAVRWLRANASKYNVDPDRIGVWGGSAGGHLVALLGTAAEQTDWDDVGGNPGISARVQAVCDYFGPADIRAFASAPHSESAETAMTKLLGGPPGEMAELAKKASPVTYVSKDDPPFFIVHGDADATVPLQQSQILFDKLKDAGVDATMLVVKNGKHGAWGPDADPKTAEILERVFSFFEKQLKNGKPKAS
jgi:acetyl esterase/lipase